jgi:hypothetical protein
MFRGTCYLHLQDCVVHYPGKKQEAMWDYIEAKLALEVNLQFSLAQWGNQDKWIEDWGRVAGYILKQLWKEGGWERMWLYVFGLGIRRVFSHEALVVLSVMWSPWQVRGYCMCKQVRPLELSLYYGRRSVDQFVLVSGSPLGPMTRFYPFLSLVTIALMFFLLGALSDERTGL